MSNDTNVSAAAMIPKIAALELVVSAHGEHRHGQTARRGVGTQTSRLTSACGLHVSTRPTPSIPSCRSASRWTAPPSTATFPPERQMTEETIPMKAIVVTDQGAGTAGM